MFGRVAKIVRFDRVRYLFCKSAAFDALCHRQKEYQSLVAKGSSCQFFTDSNLFTMVQHHYCLESIVSMSKKLIKEKDGSLLTDCQVIFIAFAFNLYPDQLPTKKILSIIQASLENKIDHSQFGFQSEDVEKEYLEQMYFVSCRDVQKQIKKRFVCIYLKFLARKYEVESMLRQNIKKDDYLAVLWEVVPYLPEQNKQTQQFKPFQKIYYQILHHESHKLSRQLSNIPFETIIDRFQKLRQIGIRISHSRSRSIHIFKQLPISFTQQPQLVLYIRVLKQFMTKELIKKVKKEQMNQYHFDLCRKNSHFQHENVQKIIQEYCEHLILMDYHQPSSFQPYFDTSQRNISKE